MFTLRYERPWSSKHMKHYESPWKIKLLMPCAEQSAALEWSQRGAEEESLTFKEVQFGQRRVNRHQVGFGQLFIRLVCRVVEENQKWAFVIPLVNIHLPLFVACLASSAGLLLPGFIKALRGGTVLGATPPFGTATDDPSPPAPLNIA